MHINTDVSAKALQDFVFTGHYARYIPDQGRRQTYEEASQAVLDMHELFYQSRGKDITRYIEEVKPQLMGKQILGSQRVLQFCGSVKGRGFSDGANGGNAANSSPVLKKHARAYNCTGSFCDRPRFFQEALWLMLCGCGVGYSVQTHHIAKLPGVMAPGGTPRVFQIPDTIEGWADAIGVLMSSYFVFNQPFPEYAGAPVEFDYSLIRPKGASIASGSGKAPGPGPLKQSVAHIRALLDRVCSSGQMCLRPIDAYDVVCMACDAVLSGGVRRAATLCVFSADDNEMLHAKTGNWWQEHKHRQNANNSALLLRGSTSYEQFSSMMTAVRQFGEPGFIWADSTEVIFNPCAEVSFLPVYNGQTGWAVCNLSEINMGVCDTPEKYYAAARGAAILGTLQAGYTKFSYLGPVTEAIVEREALLGVSMTGMMDHPEIAFNPEYQRKAAAIVKATNREVAAYLGINPAARTTALKPAGTTSVLLGVSSGIHAHHARRYFRTVRANRNDPVARYFHEHNPAACEPRAGDIEGHDWVVYFQLEAGPQAVLKHQITAKEMLDYILLTMQNWVEGGRNPELCVKPYLSHSVSNTIHVGDNEWDVMARQIYDNRASLAGVSLLADGADIDYAQAPFCEVLTESEIAEVYGPGSMLASGLIVDGQHAFEGDLWAACDAAMGSGGSLELPDAIRDEDGNRIVLPARVAAEWRAAMDLRRDWVRRAHKFSRNYFDGNVLKMTRCLKRVSNWKRWLDLAREYQPVDYSGMVEKTDNTKMQQTVACSGGSCQLLSL